MIEVQLPTASIDLDNCSVMTLQSEIDDADILEGRWPSVINRVVESGEVGLLHDDTGVTETISWGRTAKDEHGIFDVVVDVKAITLDILRVLWVTGVIDGAFPT